MITKKCLLAWPDLASFGPAKPSQAFPGLARLGQARPALPWQTCPGQARGHPSWRRFSGIIDNSSGACLAARKPQSRIRALLLASEANLLASKASNSCLRRDDNTD